MAGNFFQQAFEKTKTIANQAVDGTKYAAQKTKIKSRISSENSDLNRIYTEIGRYYYNQNKDDAPEEIKNLYDAAAQKWEILASLDREYKEVEEQEARLANAGKQRNMYGMPPQGMAPQGMPPQGMAPQGMAPQGMPPQGMAPQGMPPQGMAPQGMAPQGMPPQGMPMAPQGMAPQGMAPQGMAPQGMPPQGMPMAPQSMPQQDINPSQDVPEPASEDTHQNDESGFAEIMPDYEK